MLEVIMILIHTIQMMDIYNYIQHWVMQLILVIVYVTGRVDKLVVHQMQQVVFLLVDMIIINIDTIYNQWQQQGMQQDFGDLQ